MRLRIAGRILAGLGFMGLGATHFMVGQFTTGRAPRWPAGVPGETAWAWLTGAAIIVVGLSVVVGRHRRDVLIGTSILIAAWAFVRQLPIAATSTLLGGSWTHAGKALAFSGGLLALEGFVILPRLCLAVFFLIAGCQHFLYTPFVVLLIPDWVPGNAITWARLTGVALLCAGVGLLVRRTAGIAALLSGVMVFSWFWVVHIPRALGALSDRIAVWEALTISGLALVIATLPSAKPASAHSGHTARNDSELALPQSPELDLSRTQS